MRVLHAATFDRVAGGNLEQLRAEYRAARRLGLPWDILVWSKDEPVEPFMRQIPRDCRPMRRRYIFAAELVRCSRDYDAILIRYDINNPFLLWAGRRLGLWISEHHAIEFLEQGVSGSLKNRALARAERLLGRLLLGTCDGIVAVTDEILRYQQSRVPMSLPGRVMPNGIDVDSVPVTADTRAGVPKLFFVATNFLPWHGLAEVLAAMVDFPEPIELHLIGNVGAELMHSIRSHPKSQQIVVHGFVDSAMLPALLATGDVCLSAFNSHATGLTQGSRLKVRHMLAMGIPVIGAEGDASFPPEFRFYVQLPGLDLHAIVRYALECRSVTRAQVREAASGYIDKGMLVRDQYQWMREIVGYRSGREVALSRP